ncbi:malonate decarboxylase holo-ACP synthase [Saccharibacillus sp. CPCC 101409]|uniref:malonate decarboxylase holo-ACP synthase n=1 Tax=Saccharibacillus sp. CPCC 101409 TaxID=3058041 RepID=UPI00267134DA|nr:malonate decarboxylase holo-ACP synthase [Saccharibacillus sp. CPCC 101409]MDO3410404.1 malonate decarboxylase holo-ACP synthase [Saccharibacillus sp. CPCC 101409]
MEGLSGAGRAPLDAQPHDLLRLRAGELPEAEAGAPLPGWARRALERAPWVVVRRGCAAPGGLAVGIRGEARRERLAARVRPEQTAGRVTPYELAERRVWRGLPRLGEIAALRALDAAADHWDRLGLVWGPAGGAGFELATGTPVCRPSSDLDVVVLLSGRIAPEEARRILDVPGRGAEDSRLDVQGLSPRGGFALAEYARGGSVLLKTAQGPKLTADPWEA